MVEQDRADFYIGTNMFVYYSLEQAREVAEEEAKGLEKRAFRGPDVFMGRRRPRPGPQPSGVDRLGREWTPARRHHRVAVPLHGEEGPRRKERSLRPRLRHHGVLHARSGQATVRGTAPVRPDLSAIPPDERGHVWSEHLGGSFGLWHGAIQGRTYDWVRLFRPDGTLVPTAAEEAKQWADAAEAERRRAEAAEAELARLRALLEERGRG